jgi:hypothetical protein
MTAPTVWVHTESEGEQWRVLGVYSSPDFVVPAQPAWEHQGGQAFARIREDGWSEWLEPTDYYQSDAVDPDSASGTKPVAPERSPWARPGPGDTENEPRP